MPSVFPLFIILYTSYIQYILYNVIPFYFKKNYSNLIGWNTSRTTAHAFFVRALFICSTNYLKKSIVRTVHDSVYACPSVIRTHFKPVPAVQKKSLS
jgi:hypothetical protein